METLLQDLRYGLRMLAKNPGFTTMAVLTLALGIGTNTAIFSVLDAVVLRSLPVAAPGQLVLIEGMHETSSSIISYPMYRDLARLQQVFSDVVGSRDYYAEPLRVRRGSSRVVQAVRGGEVSANYFSTLGLVPVLGRFFVPADDDPNNPASVAVVSYDFWQRELAGASFVVGQSLIINEEPFTVIGVAPSGFTGISNGSSLEVWVPLTKFRSAGELRNRRGTFFRLIGRLKPGVTISQAETAMTLLYQQVRSAEPQAGGAALSPRARVERYRIALQPGDKGFSFFRETMARSLTILMAMGGLLLAILWANLATLLSARASARQHEIAIRQALGASHRRLVQQLLSENVLLAVPAGTLGLIFAIWASKVLLNFIADEIVLHSAFNRYLPAALEFQLNVRVLAFAEGVALLTALFAALAPTLLLKRPNLIAVLKENTTISLGPIVSELRIPLGKILVVSQVALCIVLLVSAGLTVRTVINLRGLDPGFDPTNVLLVDLDVTGTGRMEAQLSAFERSLHQRLTALPGVRSASLSWISLFSDSDQQTGVSVDGSPFHGGEAVSARFDAVSAGYFETIGMTLIAGRTFTPRDNESAPPVAIVNEAFVRRFFQNDNPIGKRFSSGRAPNAAMVKEIIGVVKDAKYNNLRLRSTEMFYVPLLQTPTSPARSIQVRTVGPPQALAQQIRAVVREADPNIVITETKTLAEQMDRTLVRERLLANLSGFFGAGALALACIGLYSVLAYQVSQRTREIGIRVALGAEQIGVMWMVMRESLALIIAGVAIGLPAALAASRLISSIVFGLKATDPTTIALAILLTAAVALFAGYLPARRASRVDPMVALRYE